MPTIWESLRQKTPTAKPAPYGDIVDWTQDPTAGDVHSPYAQGGWYPIWKNSLKGITQTASDREKELTDVNSKYYTDYAKQLKETLSAQSSLNSLLGLNRAMGLSMAGSATIANEQRNAVEGRITDYVGKSTQNLFQTNLGAANNLLGMQMQGWQNRFQQEQLDASQKFDFGSLFGTIGQIAGYALAPATGGASLLGSAAIGGAMNKKKTSLGNSGSFINSNPTFNQGGLNNWGYNRGY